MNFLIKYPTRQRPEQFFKTLDLYIAMFSSENRYHILVSCDIDDQSMNNKDCIRKLRSYAQLSFFFSKRDSKIKAINRDVDSIDYKWDIIIGAQDDSIPIKDNYDIVIAQNMQMHFPDTDGVLWFFDPFRTDLISVLIMGKKFYDRFGYIVNPVYDSMYAEKELMAVSKNLCRLAYIKNNIIEHRHYSFKDKASGCLAHDALYKWNHKPFKKDKQTYLNRRSNNFK